MDDRKTVRVGAQPGRTHMHMTRDDGISWDEPTPEHSSGCLGLSIVQDAPDKLYLLRQLSGIVGTNWPTIWASEDEGRDMIPKSGANANIAGTGGGNSIPFDCGGIRGILQLWVSATRHPLDSAEHIGDVAYPQLDSLVGTGAGTIAAGSHAAQHETGGADALAHLDAVVIDTGNLGIARMPLGGTWNLTSQLEITEAGGAAVKFLDGIEGPDAAALDINRIIAQNVDLWAGLGAGNPLLRIYGWQAAIGLRYGQFGIANADGALFIQAERSLLLEALSTTATLRTAAGSDLYFDAGDEFQWRDRDAAYALRMVLDSATGQLRLPVQGVGTGLLLGGDVLIYRSTADLLQTPDSFWADGYIITYGTLLSRRPLAGNTAFGIRIVGDAVDRFIIEAQGRLGWTDGAAGVDTILSRIGANVLGVGAGDAFRAGNYAELVDGIAAPGANAGFARIYVDTADGDLKVVFGDGHVAVIAADS